MMRSALVPLRRACRRGKPRRAQQQLEDEISELRSQRARLRTALAAERLEVKVAQTLADDYSSADEQLRRAIYDIALPALAECEATHGGVADRIRALEDAVPESIDDRQVREGVREAEEWL